ncbi:hypothetical protein SAY86_001553 [Trapa natans]|uniref:Uncharacterized protein n=1 Tax=Trapa natans TaxID=22666 RepID=A0AAN7MW71_TRANT|nr:hypothetical protein SAY86_001553 [Trapa natans]
MAETIDRGILQISISPPTKHSARPSCYVVHLERILRLSKEVSGSSIGDYRRLLPMLTARGISPLPFSDVLCILLCRFSLGSLPSLPGNL